MNRRDFLKGGLAGAFGAFLTRAGAGRGEEAVHIIEPWEVPCGDYPGCDGCPARSQCLANEDRKAFDYTEVADYDWPEYADGPRGYARNFQHNPDSDLGRLFSQTGRIDWPRTNALLEEIGILPRGPLALSKEEKRDLAGWDGVNDWCDWPPKAVDAKGPKFGEVDCNSYSGCSDCPARPRCETEPGPAPYADFHAKLDDLAHRVVEASARHKALYPEEWDGSFDGVSDNVSWYDKGTGGALMTVPASLTDCTSSESWEGGFKRSAIDGHLVCWDSIEGSDENGTGTHDDPVATQACAQSIADNLG